MRWGPLAVAALGLAAWMGACSLDNEWRAYCDHPGRCAQFDAGADASIEIAQGTSNRKILLAGQYLAGASVSLDPADAGSVAVDSVDTQGIWLNVSVNHGVPVGTPLRVHFHWERTDEDQNSTPLVVTPITVGMNGSDDAGFGTSLDPYRTLSRASEHSASGDTIHLGAGTFGSIYPLPGSPCDSPSGLKAGVGVEGESRDASVVDGSDGRGQPGTCGFNLISGDQAVRQLTIVGFAEGIRGSAPGSGVPPSVTDVAVLGCDAGVAAYSGAALSLQQMDLELNGVGLLSAGANVTLQNGTISYSAGNGVMMVGDGGTLALTGTNTISQNASGLADDNAGAGVLISSTGGTATIRSTLGGNGQTAVTVAGSGNTVTFDGADLRAPFGGNTALVLKDATARIFMRDTIIQGSPVGLRVDGLASFNGGLGDGGYGRNTLSCGSPNLEILDTRSSGPALDFGDTTIRGLHMDAGVNVTATSATLGIQLNGSTQVHFH